MKRRTLGTLISVVASASVWTAACGSGSTDADGGGGVGGVDGSASADGSASGDGATSTDGGRNIDNVGQACTAATECYPGVDPATIKGELKCLDRVAGGYCTHVCTVDEDCCAAPGECRSSLKQVCSPFESTNDKMCFLSCEPRDVVGAADAGLDVGADGDDYCHWAVGENFSCRSSGGGNQNRKICMPNPPPSDAGSDAPADG